MLQVHFTSFKSILQVTSPSYNLQVHFSIYKSILQLTSPVYKLQSVLGDCIFISISGSTFQDISQFPMPSPARDQCHTTFYALKL
jgi:hypothetical protein